MRTIPRPSLRARDVYRGISQARQSVAVRDRLNAAAPAVFTAYQAYRIGSADVTSLVATNTDPATATDLIGNYESNSRASRRLRSVVLANNQGGKCALCGQTSAATLDHYLPKQVFPEYSVFPLNLIPCCWSCNHKKGSLYRRHAAIFLHCYLDTLPRDTQFLFADVEIIESGVAFGYRVEPPVALGALAPRIRDHFEALDLATGYMVDAVHEAGERRSELRRIYEANDGDPLAIRSYLRKEANSIAADKGKNHWRFVALDSLAESDEFCAGAFG